MFGRDNIFSNSRDNRDNRSYGGGGGGGGKVGSQRLEYRTGEPAPYLLSMVAQWKDQPPSSIVTREETLHLTPTELRIEDYFLMRRKQLKQNQ
jgi:hypothetical protein